MQLLNLLAFGFSKQLKPFSAVNVLFMKPVLRLSMLALCLLLMGSAVGQATVMTDKDDYQPGNYVIITGSGWQPGETVSFHFEEEPKPATCVNPHDLIAVADSNGNIYNNQFLIKENHLGVKFTLTATGQMSGLTAITNFTDATWSLVLNSNAPYCGGESRLVNFTVQQTNNTNRNESITIIFPTGWSVSDFSPLSITDNGGNPLSKSWSVSSINSNTICLTAATSTTSPNPNRLDNNNKILFSATITAPISGSLGSFAITGRGRSNTTCSTTEGDLPTNPPSVTLSGASDIYESYAILNFGGSNVFYDLKAATGNVDFNGVNLGTFNGTQTLLLNGAENKVFKCGTRDITNGTLYYRIYPTGSPTGSFINLNLPFASNDGGAGAGCQNQTWRRQDAAVNILSGLCDGNYTIEIYTGANYQGCGTGEHLANNGDVNYKATFTVNSSNQSGIYQSAVILKLNGGGDTYYDLQGATPNFDFSGNLGSFCTNGSLVIAGGENKTFKCPNNDILNKNKLFYRIYPAGSPAGVFTEIPLSFASNDPGALCIGGQNQTWRSNSANANLIAGLVPGNYTIEVYTQASYTTNGICENVHFSNNGGANYKADFTINEAPVISTVYNNISVSNDADKCGAEVTFASASASGTPASTISYSHASGSLFPVGTTTVTVTATNSCGTDTKTFTITVTDNQDPTITAPTAVSVNADNGSCAATNVALGTPTTADNCGVASVTNNAPASFPVGSTTVTWTVTDVNGRTATATQVVTVTDNQDPTITAPAAVSVNADNGSCAATNVALGTPTTADNCGVASVTNNAPASFPVGSTTVTWTVTDVNGRTATATQVVTVTDNQNPVISNTPSNITVYTGAGSATCNKVVTWTSPTASDNCSVSTLTSTHTSGAVFPVGTTTVTYTATDVNGNTVTSSFTVAVIDNTNPVVNVQNITLNLTSAGTGTITAAQINNGSTDNCGIASMVLNKTNFTCSDLGSQTVTLTVTDINGNSASADATVLVKDVTPPTVLTKNITVNLDASGNASITAAQVDNGSSDVCGPVTLSVSPSMFNCSNVTVVPTDLIISEYVEGSSNNKYIEIFNGTSASINLSNYQLRLYANGVSSPNNTVTLSGSLASGATVVYKNGSATIYGGTSTTNAAVNFNGNDAIAITKTDGTFVDIFGRIGNDPDPSNSNGTGWISGGIQTQDRTLRRKPTVVKGITVSPSGTGAGAFTTLTSEWDVFNIDVVSGLGSHTANTSGNAVTLTVTDGSGNQSTGTAYVTVIDNIAPSLTPAVNQNVNLGASCSIVVPDVRGTATDNCAGVTITQSPLAGSSISLTHNQTTSITVTATDASGNTTVKTVVLTAKDVTPPVLTPAANQNVNLNTSCSIVVPNVIGTATDNCTGVTIAQSPVAGTVIPLAHNQTYNITVTATDAAGLTDIKTVVLTAKDVTAPTVITKNITVQLDANGNASITPADVNNGSTDNCGTVNLQSVTPATFNCTNVVNGAPVDLFISEYIEGSGNIKAIEIFNGTGNSINLSNYSIRFYSNGSTSVGTTIPLAGIIAAGDVYVLATSAASQAILVQADQTSGAAFYNGNDAVTLAKNGNNIDIFGRIGEDPGAGSNPQNGWTGTGGYQTTDRTLRRKANVVQGISTNPSAGFPTLVTEWEVFPTDNADGIGKHGLGTPVTLTVNDGNGNTSTGLAYVKVEDKVAPNVITQNITVHLDASGNASITAAQIDNGSADACGILSYSLDKTSFTCANVGANTVTLTVTDVNGNSSTATATVTVVDNIAPTAVAQNVTIYLNASGTASTTAAAVNNGSSDNCGVATLALSKTDFNCSNVGDNTVTLTVTDVNGNSSTATATVTVVDNIAPTAVAQNVTIYLNASGTASTTAEAVNNGSSDNCAVATLALSKTSFDCSNVGANTVTLTVTDVNGNSSTATAIVTVKDEVAPVAKCQNIAVYLDQSGTVSITASQINNGSTDACGIASISISQTLFTAAGTYPVILTVTDVNGNSSTCSATVTVNKRPVTLVYNGDNSEQYSDQQMLSATLTDALSGTPLSGKTITFTIGTQSVNAVTNASGIASATLILTQNPDLSTYTVKTVFNGNATYVEGNDEDAFDITDEDALAEYIGTQFQATASATSGTATVQLQASILDITAVTGNPATDAYAGTITNARVKFVLYNGSTFTDISGWLTPALINSSDSKVGVVSFDWPVNIGTADAAQYNVGIVIDNGYYIGEAPVNTITVVTVYKPLGDFVTGGGYIIPTQSGGTYAATPGLKMNFGLNVKYNKKGTNLQGGVNMIFRRNVGGVIRTYQIKSNSMTSLGTSGTSTPVVDRYAEFLSKANLTDVTNPLAPVALGGNLDLRVSMRDRGEPGSTDEIAVTLFSGTGSLLFSSKWTGSSTQRMVLTGGNIVVRGENYGAAPAVKLAGPSPTTNSITDNFNVKVLGNPSLATFRLQLQSSDKQQKITVKIVDVNGRIVEVKENLYAGQVIEVGAKYTQGTYFAEVMQGTNRKVVKLLKIARD